MRLPLLIPHISRSLVIPSVFPSPQSLFPAQSRSMSRPSSPLPSIEESIRIKIEDKFEPTFFKLRNDSSKHSHHQPMQVEGAYTGETHFHLQIRSQLFASQSRIARHRAVNACLVDEFARGLHALSLVLETEEEASKAKAKKEAEEAGK